MSQTRVFVEGDADKKFIEDYLIHLFGENEVKVDSIGGKDKLYLSKQHFISDTEANGQNLVIFDANSSFQDRRKEIINLRDELSINFDLFLFPNNSGNGDLECLLSQIINPENQTIFDCFEQYQDCLKQDSRFFVPILKTKIYAYIDTLIKDRNHSYLAKEDKRDYLNKEHWNLEHDYLNPLRDFLF